MELRSCSQQIQRLETKMQRLARVVLGYWVERKRRYLRMWYRKGMDWEHENYKKLNLVDFNVNKKRKIRFFYKWRQAFLVKKRHFESKVDGMKVLQRWVDSRTDLLTRRYICKWRDFVELRQY